MINPDSITGDMAFLFDYARRRMWEPEASFINKKLRDERTLNISGGVMMSNGRMNYKSTYEHRHWRKK